MKMANRIDSFFEIYHYHILMGAFVLGGVGALMLFWVYMDEIEEDK